MSRFAVAVAAVWVLVVWTWTPAPVAMTLDDSFYYFQIARHVAHGHGATFDGVEPTTGFHPLWMLVLVPIARAFGHWPDTFVRIVLTLQVGLVALAAYRLGRAAGRVPETAFAFAALATSAYFTKIFVNGLESALQLVFLAVAVDEARRYVESDEPDDRRLVAIGAACAAATLTRLSAIAFALLLFFIVLRRRRASLGATAGGLVAFAAPVALYAAYQLVTSGHLLTVSATIKLERSVGLTSARVVGALALAGFAALVVIGEKRRLPVWAVPLGGYALLATAVDGLRRGVVVPEIWYLVPHAALAALLLARVKRGWLAAASAPLALGSLWIRSAPDGYSNYLKARDTGRWIATHVPPSARVAGWDCGIVAFYSERSFSNLDGLASSWRFKEQYLDRDRVADFLDDAQVDFIAQYVADGANLFDDASEWRVIHEEPFAFRGVFDRAAESRRFRWLVFSRERR